jgi:hypothetical protein
VLADATNRLRVSFLILMLRLRQDELAVFGTKRLPVHPATPTEKFQVDGMIARRGDHAIDHLLATS